MQYVALRCTILSEPRYIAEIIWILVLIHFHRETDQRHHPESGRINQTGNIFIAPVPRPYHGHRFAAPGSMQ